MRIGSNAFVTMALCALAAGGAPVANSQAPLAKSQAPGFYRMMLGSFEVTALNDGVVGLPVSKMLAGEAPEAIQADLARAFLAEPVDTSFNGFLVNTGSKLVLIDTGAGSSMGPSTGHLVENLKAAGYQPAQVDEIYITHMHGDHVGGLSVGGERVFPNATVHADKHEADYWLSQAKMAAAPKDAQAAFQHAMDALQPYVKAGRFRTFEDDTDLLPGLKAWSTHGHTPGHTSYIVESQGKKLVVLGDLIHVGAVQFPNPAVTIRFDSDSTAATAQRGRVFQAAADQGFWLAGAHLSFPGIGHVRSEQGHYVWVPVNYALGQ